MDCAKTIVIDNGSGSMKSGFAGEAEPRSTFPTIVGRPKDQSNKDSYVGDEAQIHRGILEDKNIGYPVQRGIISNFDEMEKIWFHLFYNELRVEPKDHAILMTESPSNTNGNRERIAKCLFETFEVQSLCVIPSVFLSWCASAQSTGLILDSGSGVTHAVPIYHGIVREAISRLDVGGKDLSDFLRKVLAQRSIFDRDSIEGIKEKLCFIASDFNEALKTASSAPNPLQKNYTYRETNVTLCEELFRCPEALFRPSLLEMKSSPGIHELIHNSIMKCKEDMRTALFGNIVLSGGNTMFAGIENRLLKELTALAPSAQQHIRVLAPEDRKHSAWIGGSMLGSTDTCQSLTVTRAEYDEFGTEIFREKLRSLDWSSN